MKKILITGANGFIGKNLCEALSRRQGVEIMCFDIDRDSSDLKDQLQCADCIYHLAGVNRPEYDSEYETGNVGLTEQMVTWLKEFKRKPIIVFSSSIQAELDNAYGRSKKAAEDLLCQYGRDTGASVFVYRLANVFGKWCRPNYNSAVATFCHNIARGLDISVTDETKKINLVYIDDVVAALSAHLGSAPSGVFNSLSVHPLYEVELGELVQRIQEFKNIRETLVVPRLNDAFSRKLHATYISYLDKNDFAYPVKLNSDERGSLFELLKSEYFGQMFVSTTRGHITRGHHYHNTKTEKFCVIKGNAAIKFRNIFCDEVLTYRVSGDAPVVVDIPVGYTHSIENLSDDEMIVLFWSNEIFDPQQPDTYFKKVEHE